MKYSSLLLSPGSILNSNNSELSNLFNLINIDDLSLANYPCVSVIFNPQGEIHWTATNFLLEHVVYSNSTQGDTARTYARCLVKWLNYILERAVLEAQVTEYDIQLFRNQLLNTSINSPEYSVNTASLILTIVQRYHEWGEQTGQLLSPLGKWLSDQNAPKYITWGGTSFHKKSLRKPLLPKKPARIPKILSASELEHIFRRAPLPFSLQFKLALVSGLRRFELCDLLMDSLPESSYETNKTLSFSLIRKGGKQTNVYIPSAILDEIDWYKKTQRPRTPKNGHKQFLFLTKTGCKVHRNELSHAFHRASQGIEGNPTLHHLRHTFAVITLQFLQKHAENGDSINPLKTLQILMGHSSLSSTEVYLRALDAQHIAIEEALNYLYGGHVR